MARACADSFDGCSFAINHGEFIAAQSCNEYIAVGIQRETLADAIEKDIARFVTQRVVDCLEIVQVHEQHAHPGVGEGGGFQGAARCCAS